MIKEFIECNIEIIIGVDGKFGFGLGYNGIGYGTNIIKF